MQIATAYVELRVKSDKAKREARDQARSTAEEVTKTFAQVFSAAVVVNELRKMTAAASNLEQAVGGTEAVFGRARTTIDQYARSSATAMGLSERAFRELTSQIGGLLSGLGFTQQEAANTSVKLTQLGADLAATFGGRPEEAVQALGAALRGEFDPLERFGVSLRVSSINLKAVEMGLADSTSKVDDNARAQAALALITEQTANVQGQFSREADTAAGKAARFTANLEDQRAKIGEQLLPIFANAVELLGLLVDGFAALPAPVQTATMALVGVAALAGPVGKAASAFRDLGKAIPLALGNPAVLAVGALAALAGGLYYATRNTEDFNESMEAAKERVKELREEMAGLDSPVELARTKIREMAFDNETLRDAIDESGTSIDELAERAVQGGTRFKDLSLGIQRAALDSGVHRDEAHALREELNELSYDLTVLVGDLAEVSALEGEAAEGSADLGSATKATAEEIEEANRVMHDAAVALSRIEVNQSRVRDEWEEAADAAEALSSALEKVFGAYMDVDEATDNVAAATDDLTESLEENGATLDANTAAGRSNRQAVRDQVDAMFRLAEATLRAGGTTEEARAQVDWLTGALRGQLIQAGLTEAQVDEYIATLGLTPENVDTAIRLTGDQVAREKVQSHLDSLDGVPDYLSTSIQAQIDAGQYAEAEQRLNQLARTRTVNVSVNAGGGSGGAFRSAAGRFVAGGSNILSTLGELPGRTGDEVVLPLGNRSRIAELLSDPRVGGRIADAMPVASVGVGGDVLVEVYLDGNKVGGVVSKVVERNVTAGLRAGRRP